MGRVNALWLVAVIMFAVSASVLAGGKVDDPNAGRVAALRSSALEEKRWAHFLDTVYMETAVAKCLSWPTSLTDRITALKAEVTIFESTLRVSNPTNDELDKIATGLTKWRAERLSLLRDIDTMVLHGKTPPEKSIYSESGGK
ncbi:MAG TPA: hypothetical protein VF777_08800 [Phycisphaerales bacterium]